MHCPVGYCHEPAALGSVYCDLKHRDLDIYVKTTKCRLKDCENNVACIADRRFKEDYITFKHCSDHLSETEKVSFYNFRQRQEQGLSVTGQRRFDTPVRHTLLNRGEPLIEPRRTLSADTFQSPSRARHNEPIAEERMRAGAGHIGTAVPNSISSIRPDPLSREMLKRTKHIPTAADSRRNG